MLIDDDGIDADFSKRWSETLEVTSEVSAAASSGSCCDLETCHANFNSSYCIFDSRNGREVAYAFSLSRDIDP